MQVSVLLALTYFVSYVTRINYGAVLIEMEKSTGVSSTLLSLAVSGSAVTYGFGQIISGICGDKFKAKKLIIYGLWLTAAMNLLIPLVAPNVYLMTAYSSLMFAIGTVFAVLLRVFVGKNAVMSIASFGVLIGCMHGVNLMFTSMVPPLFNDKGGVAKASGIINSATYIGSAVSGTGTAVAAKAFGWTGITSIWASVALIGAVICFFLGKKRVDKI